MPHSFCNDGLSAEVKRGGLQRDAIVPLPLWTPALAWIEPRCLQVVSAR
jgi:hypothetical protein